MWLSWDSPFHVGCVLNAQTVPLKTQLNAIKRSERIRNRTIGLRCINGKLYFMCTTHIIFGDPSPQDDGDSAVRSAARRRACLMARHALRRWHQDRSLAARYIACRRFDAPQLIVYVRTPPAYNSRWRVWAIPQDHSVALISSHFSLSSPANHQEELSDTDKLLLHAGDAKVSCPG